MSTKKNPVEELKALQQITSYSGIPQGVWILSSDDVTALAKSIAGNIAKLSLDYVISRLRLTAGHKIYIAVSALSQLKDFRISPDIAGKPYT